MEEDCDNIPSAKENMECSANDMIASTSEQNMEGTSDNTASTSSMDCGKSKASTSEKKTGLRSSSERCDNCRAEFSLCKVRISSLVDAKTAKILFPRLKASSDFICMECVKMVKSKTKFDGRKPKRTWAGADSTPPPSKRDKKKGAVGGGGVPALPPAPTSTQNTEGPARYVVIPKRILSVAASKQNEGSVNVAKPNTNIVTAVGPSASTLNMAGSVKTASTSKPTVEGTVEVPPTLIPTTKASLPYVVGGRLPTVLPIDWNVRKSANDNVQSTSEQSAGVSVSEAVRRCSLCKSQLKNSSQKFLVRRRISNLVDLKTAQVLLPHLSPEEYICQDPCEQWLKSKTKPLGKSKTKRTWTGFSTDHGSTNSVSTSDGPSPAPNNGVPPTSEQSSEEGSASQIVRCSHCKKELQKDSYGSLPRMRISKLLDLKSAQVLLPHLSPEEFICIDPCIKWVNSQTTRIENQNKRTWTGFPTEKHPSAPKNGAPSTSERRSEGSASAPQRCPHCKNKFQNVEKGLGRIRISQLLDLKSAKVLFPRLSPQDFICRFSCEKWVKSKTTPITKLENSKRTCAVFLAKKYPLPCRRMRSDQDSTITNSNSVSTSGRPVSTSGRPVSTPGRPVSTPGRPVSTSGRPVSTPDRPSRRSIRNKVIDYIKNGKYLLAVKKLLDLTAGAQAINRVCQEIIHKERIKLSRDTDKGPFRKQLTTENLSSFSWKESNAWVEEKAPLTVKCLRAMFPQVKTLTGKQNVVPIVVRGEPRRAMTEEEAQQLLDKRIGMVVSVALFTRNTRNTFVQSVVGAEMWREGCSEKVFKIMNSLGLSQPLKVSRQNIARLQDDHDKEVKLWKGRVEKQLMLPRTTLAHNVRANRVPAFSLTWDRIRIASHAKHERLGGNKPTIWAFRFANRNRITFSHRQGPPKKAVEVSPDSILPSKQTYEALRQRMKTIVTRIIVDNLTALEGLRSKVVWHIPHIYSKQMEKKSDVVNLGAVPVDLESTEGDGEIMGSLIEYVPTLKEKPHQVLCCSDGLNVDAAEEPSEPTARQRFEGLVDAPPEYRKEALCYQDIMEMLLSEKSLEARGSLSQLKSVFAVRGQCIEGKCKETLQRVWDVDFITFVTSAYITLYAATECNLDAVDQQPSDFPRDPKGTAQTEWLSGLAHRLVDLVWMPPPQEDINTAAATARLSEVKKKDSCFCGEEKPGEPVVQCCSNLCGGVWFHEGCAPMDTTTDPSVTQDWFCSPECQADGTYIYCYCKEQRGGQMVQCALMDQCRRHEWYHKDCLSPSEQGNADSDESTWYCSEMCFIASDADDHVLNYTKALVWEGLYNMARRDAVREGDGEAMTDFWKMDMVLFWARDHLKDFTTCHRLLTGIEGFYPEHIRQDMKWNRVANLEGTPGGNIGLDLVSEFINHEMKDNLGRVKGIYNNEKMELCTKMAGMLGTDMDRLFVTGTGRTLWPTVSLSSESFLKKRMKADIAKFVVEYKKDHLFRYIPGRAHQGFEKFTYQQNLKTPKKMGNTMRNLAQDMDLEQPFTNLLGIAPAVTS